MPRANSPYRDRREPRPALVEAIVGLDAHRARKEARRLSLIERRQQQLEQLERLKKSIAQSVANRRHRLNKESKR